MMKKTSMKVGVIGAGAISDIYLTNMTGRFDNLEVVGIAAKHFERAKIKAEKYGITPYTVEDLLAVPEIEVIVVLTPVGAHEALIRQALEAGKHVYTEKTLTDDLASASSLLALAEEKGLMLGSAPDTFLGSALQTARKAIDEGLAGEITGFSMAANRCYDVLLSVAPFLREKGAGVALDYGVYYMTALVSLLGPVAETCAFVRAPYQQHTGILPGFPDYGQTFDSPNESEISAIFRLASGVTGTLLLDADTVLQDQAHFVIYGTKGMLYLCDPNGFGGEIRFLPNKSFNGSWEAAAPVTLAPVNPYSDNSRGVGVSEMVSAILEKRKNRASCEMAVHVLDVLTCILKSSEDREIKKTSTTFSLPEPFAVL